MLVYNNNNAYMVKQLYYYLEQVNIFPYPKTRCLCVELILFLIQWHCKKVNQGLITKEHIATFTNLNLPYTLLYNSFKIVQSLSKQILFLYNHSPLFFLNAQYMGTTLTFNIEALHLVSNVQPLKHLASTVK